MNWFSGAIAVFKKDLLLEMRHRYALNTLVLFALSSLLIVAFSIGSASLDAGLRAVLLWIIILFSAVAGLAHAFISEEERGTVLLLQLNALPSSVYVGKLLFNLLLTTVMNVVTAVAFAFVIGMSSANLPGLAVILLLGAIGLAGATTLLSAIIARASNKGPLFAVLSFPILVPLLLTVIEGTEASFGGAGPASLLTEIATLTGYAGVVITASVLLFEYIWRE